jgi:hypothetical protein
LPQNPQPFLKGAVDLTKRVVNLGVRAVEAHGDAGESCSLEISEQLRRHPRGRGRGQAHAEAEAGAVLDQLHQVRASNRVASAEDEDDPAESSHLIHEALGLGRRELERVAVQDRFGAAVLAGEIAGARRLPDDEKRSLREIVTQMAASRVGVVGAVISGHRRVLQSGVRRAPAFIQGTGAFTVVAPDPGSSGWQPSHPRVALTTGLTQSYEGQGVSGVRNQWTVA